MSADRRQRRVHALQGIRVGRIRAPQNPHRPRVQIRHTNRLRQTGTGLLQSAFQLADLLIERIRLVREVLARRCAADRLDAPDASRDRALALDLEQPDVRRFAHVRATT